MDDTGAINSLLVFRRPAGSVEQAAVTRLLADLGRRAGEDLLTYVLCEIGTGTPWDRDDERGALGPAAVVVIRPIGREWHVVAAEGRSGHLRRVAIELVQAASRAGVECLVAGSASDTVAALFDRSPVPVAELNGRRVVDL